MSKKRKRKSISKTLRFNIFKRDGFACAYCGQTPPSVILEIDHIEPFSKGGMDDINNYITACFDCNRGKRDIPLDCIPSSLVENIATVQEKESQIKEYRKFIAKIKRREKKDIEYISNIFTEHADDYELTPTFKKSSLKNFLQKLPKHEVEESMYIALNTIQNDNESVIKYFCGICWSKIRER